MTRPLNCDEVLELLVDFLKQELPQDLAAVVEQHLKACRPCEGHARFEMRFVVMLEQRLGKETCPDRVKVQILEALKNESST